ncbi:ABC transporter permease [Krasilnikovia sp. MM14-A1004]|uniref:ABC transporter permease n=1 Tax=Krasilnikovia sp. MM14-A1004 TaxID=3373541 RepID=UPI00399C85B0
MTELATTAPETVAPSLPARRRTVSAVAWPLLGLALAVGGWWLATELFAVQTIILPAPPDVLSAFRALHGELLAQTGHTAAVTVLGFALSVVVGVLIGAAIATWRPFERMFQPLLVAFNAVPKVALAPLMLIWFGYGRTPVLAMAFMVCFFPIVLSTATGLSTTPADLAELVRSMDASRLQTFRTVRVPAALPQIFVGLKVAMPLALIGVVVGEMQYGESGLGTIIVQTSGQGDTATAFAAIVLLALVSIVLYYSLVLAERLLLPWVRATTSAR